MGSRTTRTVRHCFKSSTVRVFTPSRPWASNARCGLNKWKKAGASPCSCQKSLLFCFAYNTGCPRCVRSLPQRGCIFFFVGPCNVWLAVNEIVSVCAWMLQGLRWLGRGFCQANRAASWFLPKGVGAGPQAQRKAGRRDCELEVQTCPNGTAVSNRSIQEASEKRFPPDLNEMRVFSVPVSLGSCNSETS